MKIDTISLATLTTGICLRVPFDGEKTAFTVTGGQPVFTHQLGRFMDVLRPHVEKHLPGFPMQFPEGADFQQFAESLRNRWGEEVELPMLDLAVVDPAKELKAMTGREPIVLIGPP
jgi:hypothetical protein